MSLFLIVTCANESFKYGRTVFAAGLDAGRLLSGMNPVSIHEQGNTWAASFPRLDGSSAPITLHPGSGNWLLTAGQWFHETGYGNGSEERLLYLCETIGIDQIVHELEGFFTLNHFHADDGQITVINDVIGSYHCFYREWPGVTAISSSSLLLSSLGDEAIDPEALREFLATDIIYEDRTLDKNVRKLGPAGKYIFRDGKLWSSSSYWPIRDISSRPLSNGDAVGALRETLSEAGRKIFTIFQRPLVDLTGGYDSRVLLAALLRLKMPFSTVVTGSGDSPDVQISRGLANLVGLPHLHMNPEVVLSGAGIDDVLPLTDGEYDAIEYSRVSRVHTILSEKFDISLNGSFGELARGYWWELLFPHLGAAKEIDARMIARHRFAGSGPDLNLLGVGNGLSLEEHFAEIIRRVNRGFESAPNTLQVDNLYLMMRMQCWQGRIASSTNRIWPCLSPFMFRTVLEVMLRTDPQLRRRGLFVRKYLAATDRRLAEFPLEHGFPALPVSLATFHRFWPIIPLYGGKAVRKALSKIGIQYSQLKSLSTPPRIRLWQDERVQDLLDTGKMRLASLFRADVLHNFMECSKRSGFPYDAQWARILTVESALRKSAELRRSIHINFKG